MWQTKDGASRASSAVTARRFDPCVSIFCGSLGDGDWSRRRDPESARANRSAQTAIGQIQQLTALGELVSTTTHEFNNVLMTIINYAKMGCGTRTMPPAQGIREDSHCGQSGGEDYQQRAGHGPQPLASQEPTDLVKLIEDTLLLLEREMNKYRVTVEKHFHAVPEACVSSNQIQQVLLNLLINARQAMPGGGRVLIKLVL